jgi:hypothetical protein
MSKAFGYCLLVWLGLLALAVGYRMLRGDIRVSGLLRTGPENTINPDRLQNLFVFLFIVGAYLVEFTNSPSSAELPEIPDGLLILLAGSNSLYLAGKISRGERPA